MKTRIGTVSIATFIVAIGVFAFFLGAQAEPQRSRQSDSVSPSSSQAPDIVISTMPDAPLQLRVIEGEPIDSYEPEVKLMIVNTTPQTVTAYSLRYDLVSNGKLGRGGMDLTQFSTAQNALKSGESQETTLGGGAHYSAPIERLVVSIDFVEFGDGSTWGADTYESKECLSGMRAGGRAAVDHLLRVFDAQGYTTFVEQLDRDSIDIPVPPGHSAKWEQGFRRGVSFIKGRTKRDLQKPSFTDVKSALTQPFDALEDINKR